LKTSKLWKSLRSVCGGEKDLSYLCTLCLFQATFFKSEPWLSIYQGVAKIYTPNMVTKILSGYGTTRPTSFASQ
jgi:hypothetical protein